MHTIALALMLLSGGKDDTAILKTHEEFAAQWNKHDPKAMAAVFAEDADLMNPAGRHAKGHVEVEKLLTDEQTGPMKASHFSSDCKDGVRMLKPDIAAVTCSWEITGAKDPSGKDMPTLKGTYTTVMMRAKGKWWVAVGRAMSPVPTPQPRTVLQAK